METTIRQSLITLVACATLGGCAAPTVNLATSDPIKVDINMRLDVYQYGATGGATQKASPNKPAATADQSPEARRRNRMADIQVFKSNQIVGEGHQGLLVIQGKISEQDADYREYIRKTIDEENGDRLEVMKALADSEKTSLPEIQSKQAEIWRNRSWKGELIEVPQPDGTFKWLPKEG